MKNSIKKQFIKNNELLIIIKCDKCNKDAVSFGTAGNLCGDHIDHFETDWT
jgi:predicted HTH domain antitoxin